MIVILVKFPLKAKELKESRDEDLRNQSNVSYEFTEIDASKEKADELTKLFLDESGVVDFVNDVEKIKIKNRALSKVSFTRQKGVKDRTGNFGIPVVIDFRGSWESILLDLTDLEALPFLLRPVSIDLGQDDSDPTVINLKYGGLLYVVDRLGESR